jgi:hypothetical protein
MPARLAQDKEIRNAEPGMWPDSLGIPNYFHRHVRPCPGLRLYRPLSEFSKDSRL